MLPHVAHLVVARRRYLQVVSGRAPRRRPMPRALHPKAIAISYTRLLLGLVADAREATRKVYPKLEAAVARAAEAHGRTDSVDEELDLVKAGLLQGPFSKGRLRQAVQPVARRTSAWQAQQLQRQLRAAVGVDVPLQDPTLQAHIESFTEENVGLITSIPQQTLAQVQQVVLGGMGRGSRWEEVADDIESRFAVTESRAALIARDQVGKFYASLNETRQRQLGVSRFTWRTANDERTCAVCGPLDGKSFDWKKPPKDGPPGHIHPQCRCSADPDVDGLLAALEGRR